MTLRCLVVDLGAGSGRVMLARYDGHRLALAELHRFGGYAVDRVDGPHWDVPQLLSGIEGGLRKARDAVGQVDAIGIDSWGLDYGLFDASGRLLGEPSHYRHPRSQRGHAACPVPADERFALTGAQDLPVNTLHQLHDEARHHPDRHREAFRLLMMADVVNHHLTGESRGEITLARTTGLLDAATGQWSRELCDRLGVPPRLLPSLLAPGDTCGYLRPYLAEALEWERVPVIAVAAHDTASAVAALGLDDGSGFLILGSWSLIGVEQSGVDTRPAVLQAGFGNEGGVAGRPFLVRSLNGLHLVHKLRDSWERRTGEAVGFAELSRRAAASRSGSLVNPADPAFFNPADMVAALQAALATRGSKAPLHLGTLARALYEGLAAEIGAASGALEALVGRPLPTLKLCGGGAQDELLCRLVAEATGKPLRIGPVEASAWGNAVVQLMGLGAVESLDEGRRLIERSAEFRDLVRT